MPRVDLRFRIVQPGGEVRWVHHESELVLDQHGLAVRWIGTYKDVTEAFEAEKLFKLVFEDNPVPMWLFDPETLKFLAVNDAAVVHYGYDRGSFLKLTLLDIVPQRDRDAIEQAIRNRSRRERNPQPSLATFQGGWDGNRRPHLLAPHHVLRPARAACGDHGCDGEAPGRGTHRPYGASRCADRFAKPGVVSRAPRRSAVCGVRRDREKLAVLYLDLDQFKNVNDGLGHPAGDKLLVAVAERLRTCLRVSDMVARFGGDEFAVLQIGFAGPHEASALAERIVTLLSEPYDIDGQQVVIGASVGIALAPADGETAEQLLGNADMALYQAKEDGRRNFRFFQPGMGASLRAQHTLGLDLRRALAAGEFEVYYQPLVTLETGIISGFEALLRWHHPVRGMVAPATFIPLAEETGLIVPIGEWVLRQACAEAAAWPDDLKVAVNLSPVQFKKGNLPQMVFATLASAGLPAARLELEITESIFLAESKTNLATLRRLRALGVGISMDDFGTGYSGLSYLRAFPFDKIKIDRSFISELGESADCMAIIQAITNLGSNLGIPTLAEGVETQEQLELLRKDGLHRNAGLFVQPAGSRKRNRGIAEFAPHRPAGRDEYLLTA